MNTPPNHFSWKNPSYRGPSRFGRGIPLSRLVVRNESEVLRSLELEIEEVLLGFSFEDLTKRRWFCLREVSFHIRALFSNRSRWFQTLYKELGYICGSRNFGAYIQNIKAHLHNYSKSYFRKVLIEEEMLRHSLMVASVLWGQEVTAYDIAIYEKENPRRRTPSHRGLEEYNRRLERYLLAMERHRSLEEDNDDN